MSPIARTMKRRGRNIVTHLGNFLVLAETWEARATAQLSLISLLFALGFTVDCEKVVAPSQRVTFLGLSLILPSSVWSYHTGGL